MLNRYACWRHTVCECVHVCVCATFGYSTNKCIVGFWEAKLIFVCTESVSFVRSSVCIEQLLFLSSLEYYQRQTTFNIDSERYIKQHHVFIKCIAIVYKHFYMNHFYMNWTSSVRIETIQKLKLQKKRNRKKETNKLWLNCSFHRNSLEESKKIPTESAFF